MKQDSTVTYSNEKWRSSKPACYLHSSLHEFSNLRACWWLQVSFLSA